ncbi:MAG: MarR family winged helix-turn-helix transcriptional regulator [Eubacteriales bacterium]
MREREQLIKNFTIILPHLLRKVMKKLPDLVIPKQQIDLLHHICICNGKTMSYYSEVMLIPKSNLTVLADKLIKEGLAVRELDTKDRRSINLNITDKGIAFMRMHNEMLQKEIHQLFAALDDEDIKTLNHTIYEMKMILTKLE